MALPIFQARLRVRKLRGKTCSSALGPCKLTEAGRCFPLAFQCVRLHADPNDPNHIEAREEYYLMEKQFEADKNLSLHRSFELFRTKANRKRALLSMVLMVGDQFLGVYVLANYGVLIYANLGLTVSNRAVEGLPSA